jgi:Uma2 family endonuclease
MNDRMGEEPIFLTRAAEGLERRGFTMAEVEKMIEGGIIGADERFELIGGEIVPVNPQAMPHLLMKGRLAWALKVEAPADLDVVQDATVVLGPKTFFDADILAFRADKAKRYVEPKDVVLAVEIADSSRARDLYMKAPRYGAAGVPELWVVELNEEQTYVFRSPGTPSWEEPRLVPFHEPLSAQFLPNVAIQLAELA